MKKLKVFIILSVCLMALCLVLASCEDTVNIEGGGADSRLNGTWWIREGMYYEELNFYNGSFETSINNIPHQKGTYTTNGNKLTNKVSHIWGQSYLATEIGFYREAKWYTSTEYLSAIKNSITEEEWAYIHQVLQNGTIYTYSVGGNTLILTVDLSQVGETGTQTTIWTRK